MKLFKNKEDKKETSVKVRIKGNFDFEIDLSTEMREHFEQKFNDGYWINEEWYEKMPKKTKETGLHPSYSDPSYREYEKYFDKWVEERIANVTEEEIKDYIEESFCDPTSLLEAFGESENRINLEANLVKNNLKTIIENLNKEDDCHDCYDSELSSARESLKSEVVERVK